jgi:hypothetical protein
MALTYQIGMTLIQRRLLVIEIISNKPKHYRNLIILKTLLMDCRRWSLILIDILVLWGNLLVNTDFTMFVVERKLTNSDTWILSQAPWPWACNPNWCLHIGYRSNTVFTFYYFYNGIDYSSNNLGGTQTRMHTFYFNKLSGKKYWLNGGSYSMHRILT